MGTHGPTDTRGRWEEASDSASSGCPRFYSIPRFENGNWFHHHAHGSAPVRSVCTCRDAPMSPHPRPSSRDTKIIPGATWQSLNLHLVLVFFGMSHRWGGGSGWHWLRVALGYGETGESAKLGRRWGMALRFTSPNQTSPKSIQTQHPKGFVPHPWVPPDPC